MSLTATGISRKKRSSLIYPDLQLARCPVAHCNEIPVPVFGEIPDINDKDSSRVREDEKEGEILKDYTPHPFLKKELNDLVADLSLSNSSAELLTSRLKEKNVFSDIICITFFRNRHQDSLLFFSLKRRT